MRSFKKFWRDYWECCKGGFTFVKRHWLGCIIFYIVAVLVMFVIYCPMLYENLWESLKDKFNTVFKKDERKDFFENE